MLLALLVCLIGHAGPAAGGEREDLAAAIALWNKRLEAAKDPALADQWALIARKLGGLYAAAGNLKEARPLLFDAMRWHEEQGPERELTASLVALGIVCQGLGDTAPALGYLSRAVRLARRLKQPAWEVAALSALGVAQLRIGEPRAALKDLEDALRLRRSLGDRRGEAATEANIGIAHLSLGGYATALEHFDTALGIQEDLGLRLDKARTLADIAAAFERLGAYRKAAEHLQQALVVCETTGPRSDHASVLTALGRVEVLLGDCVSAIGRHERALELLEDLGSRDLYAAALADLGAIHESLGATRRALELHKQALAVFQDLGDRAGEAAGLRRVGAVHARMGHHSRALQKLEQALRICRELRDDRGEILTLGSLGNAYLAAGRLLAAKSRHEQALDRAVTNKERAFEASTRGNLGLVHMQMNEPKRALELQEQALAIARELGLRRTVLLNRWGIALARLALGEPEATREQVRLAAEEIDASIAGLDDVAGPDAREVWAGLFDVGVLAAAALGDADEAFACMEHGRARSLLDALGGRATLAALTLPPELAEAEARARDRERQALLAKRAARRTGRRSDIQRCQRALDEARRAVAAIVVRAQREARAAADIVHPAPPDLETVQKIVREGEVLVVYALVGARAFAVVITHGDRRLVELGSATEIRAACEDLEPENKESAPGPAVVRLRRLVVEPLALPKGTTRLLLCPHDALSYIPMTLLVPGRDVVYVPSGASYVLLSQERAERGKDVLALGDPAYGTVRSAGQRSGRRRGQPLIRLPATRTEAKAVGDRVLLGKEACISRFFEVVAGHGRWRAVHFACHGIVDAKQPFQSALALTPEEASDGYLTALDLLGRSIPADLTVLSGCETGRGRLYRAEGIVGLTRAFMFAGSPSILCSLWKVDDEATRTLMERFYELWNPADGEGLSAATALRQAQQYVRGHKRWRHPYYWAAWVLWGLPQ